MNLRQHFFKNQAFSLVELLTSMLLFSFLVTGILALYSSQVSIGQSIAFKGKLESIHDKFQYLLSQEEHCTNFIGGKINGAHITIGTHEIYDDFNKLINKGNEIKANVSKIAVGLKSVTVHFDPNPNKSKVFANLHFTYLVRSRIEEALNKKIKWIRVLVNTRQTADGKIVISDCTTKVQESCSADQKFLSRFSSSGFDIPKKEGLPSGYNTQFGAEYTHKSSNIFKAPYVGEYCLNHNICNNNQWTSNTLCYDSCQNKFWTDGLNTYVNKKTLDIIKDAYICKDKNLTFNNTRCAKQAVSSIDLPEGQYNQNKSIIKTITDSSNKTIGKAEFIFQCSYAGTWQLKYATCKQAQNPKKPNLFTIAWDINTTNTITDNPELLCTSNHTLDIKTHDYATSNKTQSIKINMLYKDQTFPIGTPKRITFGFSSATIACKSNNKWQQIGDTSLNCEGALEAKPKPVDILFVVDDSRTMEDDQVKLSQAMDNFLEEFFKTTAHNIDYRIAVITTTHHRGRMFHRGRVTRRVRRGRRYRYAPVYIFKKEDYIGSEVKLKKQLKRALKPGTRGSGYEYSLLSANMFITEHKTSFFRKKAILAIFFLTDEDNLENGPRSYLKQKILTMKNNNKNLILVKSATGAPCSDSKFLTRGDRIYRKSGRRKKNVIICKNPVKYFVQQFNGDNFDIKDISYGKQMGDFAEELVQKALILSK